MYANSLFPLGMLDGDAMEDIVDKWVKMKLQKSLVSCFSFFGM
jgi:hypothetical protein